MVGYIQLVYLLLVAAICISAEEPCLTSRVLCCKLSCVWGKVALAAEAYTRLYSSSLVDFWRAKDLVTINRRRFHFALAELVKAMFAESLLCFL